MSPKNTAKETGLIQEGKLNEVIEVRTRRKNGRFRIQQNFENCPTLTEQHTAHLSDINYLMERHKPDELAAYIAARANHRREILGHDFSQEPSLQNAKNIVYEAKKNFDDLPEDIKINFKNHVEFLKFIDNPANEQKMLKLGLLDQKKIDALKGVPPEPPKQEHNKEEDNKS